MAYAAEWDLDDPVLDREEVEAVVHHVAAMGHVAAEVTRSRRGLHCTFRFPVHLAPDVVAALDPGGQLLGEDWYRDLDPPFDGEDGYTVRVELLGPVDGGFVDDDPATARDDNTDDSAACLARLRVESFDNREAWPVAFALAAAIVERLGGDLRDDFDEDLFLQQLHVPRVTGPAVVGAGGVELDSPPGSHVVTSGGDDPDDVDDDDDALLN